MWRGLTHTVPTAYTARGLASTTGPWSLLDDQREKKRRSMHRYREKMKQDPYLRQLYRERQRQYDRKYSAKRKPRKE